MSHLDTVKEAWSQLLSVPPKEAWPQLLSVPPKEACHQLLSILVKTPASFILQKRTTSDLWSQKEGVASGSVTLNKEAAFYWLTL